MNINFEQNKDPYGYSYVNCFYNLKKDYVFTSQKVCCNTFRKIKDEEQKLERTYDVNDSFHINCLVRNPYTRVESLYKDKLLIAVTKGYYQNCQLELIKVFGEYSFLNKEISFERFIVEGIPTLIDKESHFFPQSKFIPKFVDNIYHLEIKEELDYVFSLFSNNHYHMHKTYDFDFVWTTNMKDTISNLYKEDFERYSYNIQYKK